MVMDQVALLGKGEGWVNDDTPLLLPTEKDKRMVLDQTAMATFLSLLGIAGG